MRCRRRRQTTMWSGSNVDEETQSQLDELRRERAAHARRLGILREQAAVYGRREVPPHILTDIDEASTAIGNIDTQIGKILSGVLRMEQQRTLLEAAEPDAARRDLWAYTYKELETVKAELKKQAELDSAARQPRQQRQDLFYLAILLMLAAILYQVWR